MRAKLIQLLNDYTIKKKLRILYICCVLLPLVLTDTVILSIVIRKNQESSMHDLENISNAVKYNLITKVDNVSRISKNIYTNQYVNDFLNYSYEDPLEYFDAYQDFLKGSLFTSSISVDGMSVVMYSENDTIVSGGIFSVLNDVVKKTQWYQQFLNSGEDSLFYIYYDKEASPFQYGKRKISLIKRLNFYYRNDIQKILKIDLGYSFMSQDFLKMNYDADVYVCQGDQVLLSNTGTMSIGKDFDTFEKWDKVDHKQSITILDLPIDIYVINKVDDALYHLWKNTPLIMLLILVNAFLPWVFMKILNQSFVVRLHELSVQLNQMDSEMLHEIETIQGNDEIGNLMISYNKMVIRINELIQTVYKDKLKEQEIDIARQKAELLALHSQINPHFLFNALESIRMHSIIKGEKETATMVEKLALMQRQYVDWGSDHVSVQNEMLFVEAYLELQKYRFGEKLNYSLEMEEASQSIAIPKLTLVTFVENACIHGIEKKATSGWVFVRAYVQDKILYLEIEDTGNGIKEPLLSELLYNMRKAGIASLKKKGRVGIMNACLRIRMMTKDKVQFNLESEEGVGTIITIKIPV